MTKTTKRRKLNAINGKFLLLSLMFQGKNKWHFGGGLAETIREADTRIEDVFQDSAKGFGWDMHKLFEHLREVGTIEKKKIGNCCYFKLVI